MCSQSPCTPTRKQPTTIHEPGVCLGIIQTAWDNVAALFTAVHKGMFLNIGSERKYLVGREDETAD